LGDAIPRISRDGDGPSASVRSPFLIGAATWRVNLICPLPVARGFWVGRMMDPGSFTAERDPRRQREED
jgi:hypothetical protein